MATSSQDTSKASSDGASGSSEVSNLAACDPEERLLQAIRDRCSEVDLRSYLNSIFEKIGDEAKNAKDGETKELGVSPGLDRRLSVYDKALGAAEEGSAIETSLLRELEIDEQLTTYLRAGTSCRKISCWAARCNMVNTAMALVRRNMVAQVAGKPDPLPEQVLAIAVEYGHVQLVKSLIKLQPGVAVNGGYSDLPGADRWTNAGAGAVPQRLTDDRHLNEYERHGFKFLVPIRSAARMGNVEMVKTLSECNEITDVEWALHWAAIMGHHHVVRELLNSKREVDVNKPVYNMTYPTLRDPCSTGSHVFNSLHIASFYGHLNVVKALCEDSLSRLRANTASKGGVTADQMVAEMGHVQVHLQANTASEGGVTAVQMAAEMGHVQGHLQANTASEGGVTAVQMAAEMGHVQGHLQGHVQGDLQANTASERGVTAVQMPAEMGHVQGHLQANTASEGGVTAVQMAAEMGHVQGHLQANTASEGGVTAVQMAAEMGHVQIVKILLERSDVEIAWALHGAAKKGHDDVVEELLNSEKVVDVNTLKQEILDDAHDRSSFGEEFNPLHLASIYGHASVVWVLCEDRRLQVNVESKPAGMTALELAVEKGHVDIVKMLLQRPDVQIRRALHGAAKKGHHNVVQELFSCGKEVDVNTLKQEILEDAQDRSSFGEEFNPLHLASIYGHASVVQVLCEDRRLEVNVESKPAGMTALQMATEKGHAEIVKMLLESPEVVEIRWALHKAAKKGYHNVVLELLNSGREVFVNTLNEEILDDAQDRSSFGEEFNPLHLASIYGHTRVVEILCEDKKGRLEVNTQSAKEMTALQMAMEKGHVDTAKILLDRPEVETRQTLHKAAKQGHHDVVRKLLESGTEMEVNTLAKEILDDAQDRLSFGEKFNPLHLASIYGHVRVVEVLCVIGDKTLRADTESGAGMTAVQIARRKGHAEIEKILLARTEVQKHLDRLYRDRQVHVDAANSILVGATLIASVTFAAWLQPPLGYSEFYGSTSIDVGAPLPSGMYPSFVSVAGHPILDIFWIFNSMSFLFAIATLTVGAHAARPPKQDKDIGEVVRALRTLLSLAYSLLTASVACVLGAFATAGFVVLPPVRRYTVTMGATLGIGLLVVLISTLTSSWIISSWISSKVLSALKIIKAFFATILHRLAP